MSADELAPVSGRQPLDAQIAQAQSDIRAADVLTAIYPLWWLSMPAIMKGYIDRVLQDTHVFRSTGFDLVEHGGNGRGSPDLATRGHK